MNPPLRATDAGADSSGWGRWDTHGGRTVYAAGTRRYAFAEQLASHQRRLGAADPLVADAAFLGLSATELVAQLEAEWQQRGNLGIWVPGPAMAAGTRAVPTPAALWWLVGAAGAPGVDGCGRSGAGGAVDRCQHRCP